MEAVIIAILSLLTLGGLALLALRMVLKHKGPVEVDMDIKRGGLKVKKGK